MRAPLAPDEAQRLLLRAAVLEDDAGRAAWDDWRQRIDIERLDPGSTRLLPLLYRRLLERGTDDPLLPRLKGVYRHTWSANGLLLADAARVLELLAIAGVPAVVLDGTALISVHYRDQGARGVDALVLLIAPERLHEAGQALASGGWVPPEDWTDPGLIATASRARFAGRDRPVYLCWDPFPEGCAPGVRRSCWDAAVPAKIAGMTTAVLGPTDELLQLCVRASRWEEPAPFRRLADVAVVLRGAGDRIDWSRLAAQAKSARVILPVLTSLRLLRAVLDAPVSGPAMQQLAASSVGMGDRLEQYLQERPGDRFGRFPQLVFRHSRLAGAGAAGSGVRGLARYLQTAWGTASLWEIPFAAVRRGIRRILGRKFVAPPMSP